MSRKTIPLEVESPAEEQLLRQYHALLQEMQDLADAAPAGAVMDVLEGAVLARGREALRSALEVAVQRRIDAAEKKGRRCGGGPAARSGKTAATAGGRCSVASAGSACAGTGGASAAAARRPGGTTPMPNSA
jgi:hypothetical protein